MVCRLGYIQVQGQPSETPSQKTQESVDGKKEGRKEKKKEGRKEGGGREGGRDGGEGKEIEVTIHAVTWTNSETMMLIKGMCCMVPFI
jgi:hypothetical protein